MTDSNCPRNCDNCTGINEIPTTQEQQPMMESQAISIHIHGMQTLQYAQVENRFEK
jgi:hypothetical protein